MGVRWLELFSERARAATSSALGDLLAAASTPGVISLAGGLPAAELFPMEAFRDVLNAIMASPDASSALQYGPTEGYPPLRSFIAERMSRLGAVISVEEVLVTTGSQQGLDLVGKLFIDPGSVVALEDPSYVGGLQAFSSYHARYLAVPTDEHGMQVELLEEMLPRFVPRPRLIYVLPNFQNPSGGTLSLARRYRLLELSYRYGIPILEDDPYWELRYEGEHLPSLKSLDTEGSVIYLGTFSKTLAPGLRLGWAVAPREVVERLSRAKQGADLHTDSLAQRVVYEICRADILGRHVEAVKLVYRERRDTMLRALERQLPAGSACSRPQGGLFLWACLPGGIDTAAMLPDAVREGVAYVPGAAFHPNADRHNSLRLNFSNPTVPEIEEAIGRLGRVLGRWCQQADAAAGTTVLHDLAAEAA